MKGDPPLRDEIVGELGVLAGNTNPGLRRKEKPSLGTSIRCRRGQRDGQGGSGRGRPTVAPRAKGEGGPSRLPVRTESQGGRRVRGGTAAGGRWSWRGGSCVHGLTAPGAGGRANINAPVLSVLGAGCHLRSGTPGHLFSFCCCVTPHSLLPRAVPWLSMCPQGPPVPSFPGALGPALLSPGYPMPWVPVPPAAF